MAYKISVIPKKLPWISWFTNDWTPLVPFPAGISVLKTGWIDSLREHLVRNPYVLLGYPESSVAVFALVKSFQNIKSDNGFMNLGLSLNFRVIVDPIEEIDDLFFCEWREFEETQPTPERFKSKYFEDLIDKLRKLMAQILIYTEEENITLSTRRLSEQTVSHFIDECAMKLNEFAETSSKGKNTPIRDRLVEILTETDIEQRLIRTIGLASVIFEEIKKTAEGSKVPLGKAGSVTDTSLRGKFEVKKDKIPPEVGDIIETELKRLGNIGRDSLESSIGEKYVERLLKFPWGVYTEDNTDLLRVEEILNEDHFGLFALKERVIEFLAARQLNPKMKAPIILFAGAPGLGKTSLGQSIARALGRKFIRTSLGGINDEAEIRGHRRTYIGANPGRIIEFITRCGSMNPIFMLDEVDKLGHGGGSSGDPRSALLEVLDPEQNFSFVDNYLAVGVDLSKVLFITTANIADHIPEPLLDRMELIEFLAYTEDEKIQIAKLFLVPKQLRENGLSQEQFQERGKEILSVEITDAALRAIINDYTAEAGVRHLEKRIASIARKIARRVKQNTLGSVTTLTINENDLVEYLKKPLEKHNILKPLPIGVAPVAAVSHGGGSIFFVETAYRKDSDHRKIKVTGVKGSSAEYVGRIIEESADIAWDFLFKEGGILQGLFTEKMYLRIHFPDGSTPKDGPSAGIPILFALYSLFTNQPVKPYLASTGEITLSLGEIEPVGGIKEKILAAARAGAKQFLVPKANLNDVDGIPQSVKDQIEITPCQSMMEALTIAFPDCPRLKKDTN